MTEEKFEAILRTYGNYWETRGKDPDTWGMFTIFGLTHRSSRHLGISLQFCNPDGTGCYLMVLNEFLALFGPGGPVQMSPSSSAVTAGERVMLPPAPENRW